MRIVRMLPVIAALVGCTADTDTPARPSLGGTTALLDASAHVPLVPGDAGATDDDAATDASADEASVDGGSDGASDAGMTSDDAAIDAPKTGL